MPRSAPVDGFCLAYGRHGAGDPVVLLHGWPGDRTDFGALVPRLERHAEVVAPDLRGFGASDKHPVSPADAYSAAAQARSVLGLVDGRPAAVRAYLRHFWSHWSGPAFEPGDRRLAHLLDGYGPPGALTASVGWYRAGSGTVATSLAERAPAPQERIAVPTTVLWPEHDPLFPRAWSDRLEAFFSAAELEFLDGVGHFTPVEAPQAFAAAIRRRLAPSQ